MKMEWIDSIEGRILLVTIILGLLLWKSSVWYCTPFLILFIGWWYLKTRPKLAEGWEDGNDGSDKKNDSDSTVVVDNNEKKTPSSASASSSDMSAVPVDPLPPVVPVEPVEQVLQAYHAGTKENPFGNFMLTDPVDRAAARPAFCPEVSNDIASLVRKQTQMLNPDITNASSLLYGDEYDLFELNTGLLRNMYTVANTQKVDAQDAFAQWLYGDMLSAKTDGPGGALARVQDNERYLLY